MRSIMVSEVYKLHGTATASVPEDTSLEDVISRFAYEAGLRGIFLTDSFQRLVGIITPCRPNEVGTFPSSRWQGNVRNYFF